MWWAFSITSGHVNWKQKEKSLRSHRFSTNDSSGVAGLCYVDFFQIRLHFPSASISLSHWPHLSEQVVRHDIWSLCAAWSLDHTGCQVAFPSLLCSWQFIKQMHQRGQGDDCLTSSSIPAPKCVSMVLCCKQLSWQSVRRLQEGTCRTSPSGGWPKVKCIDT